jgi:hypothetical protein
MDMNIVNVTLHQIDQSKNELLSHEIDPAATALNDYIKSLIENIFESGRDRAYEFQSDTKEVCAALKRILDDGDFVTEADVIGKRLLKSEIGAQAEIEHLKHSIPKGSLVQAQLNNDDGKTEIVISKADHTVILDEESFEERRGLPIEKKVFKAALVSFDKNKTIKSVKVYETGSAKYWWGTFLELNEKRSDSLNTKTAIEKIDDKVLKPLKRLFPADYVVVRNSTIGYFRTKTQFELGDFFDTILNGYAPIDDNFPVDRVKDSITKLQTDGLFDRRFNLDSSVIKQRRIPTTVWLRPEVKIEFLGDLTNQQVGTRSKDDEGNKFVKIRVDDTGYAFFPDE